MLGMIAVITVFLVYTVILMFMSHRVRILEEDNNYYDMTIDDMKSDAVENSVRITKESEKVMVVFEALDEQLERMRVQVQELETLVLEKPIIDTSSPYEKLIQVHEGEYEWLCRLVESEAGICDFETKRAVACVVVNRVISDNYPDTITEVIYEDGQFDVVANGSIHNTAVTEESKKAVDDALMRDYINNAVFFMVHALSGDNSNSWVEQAVAEGRLEWVDTMDKDVTFYKIKEGE